MANMTTFRGSPRNAPVPTSEGKRDRMIMRDYRDGVQKTGYGFLVGGVGWRTTWWYENASGVDKHWWANVGIAPIIGRQVSSVKYYRTYDEAQKSASVRSLPSTARGADSMTQGDSVTYLNTGGIMFSAATGLGVVGIGPSAIAQGTWETYIEKIDNERVYVKITKGKLASLSMSTGVAIVQLSVTAFKNRDDGFSYLYNLNTQDGRRAYEDAIRGNIIASDMISRKRPKNLVEKAPVLKVSTFTSINTGRFIGASMGLPIIWNSTYTKGNINSYSTTDFHINNKTARAHYGIYSENKNFQLWNRHRETDLMFYGAKYIVKSKEETDAGTFGRFTYAYRNEQATHRKVNKAFSDLIQHTGIDELEVLIPEDNDLGYAGFEFNTTLSEDNTLRLMKVATQQNENYFQSIAERYLREYRQRGDAYNYCRGIATGICWNRLENETQTAMSEMHKYLEEMAVLKTKDARGYAAAYGRFGRAMSKNHFAFRTALEIAGPGAEISYLIEGARVSMYYKAWRTTSRPNQWEVTDNPNAKEGGYPFVPRLRHSQIQGLIVNPGLGGIEHFNSLTTLEPQWSLSSTGTEP